MRLTAIRLSHKGYEMSATTYDTLLRATARAAFWQGFEQYPDLMDGIVARVPSDADQESYEWLAYAPGVREMIGDRQVREVPAMEWIIKNKKFENTVRIPYKLRKYGKNNIVAEMLKAAGAKARAYPSKLVATLLNTGDATLCYDGLNFYDDTHVDPGADYTANQDNNFTTDIVAEAAATDLEMYAELKIALAAYYSFKDGDGDPVVPGGNPTFVVMCPAGQLPAARSVFVNDNLTGPISNELKGMFEPRLNAWSDATDEIFTFHTSGAKKPFIYQTADPIILEDDIDNGNEFMTKDVHFGSFGYYNVSYGDWRYSTRHIFTTT
jgi:phage major head subunit gpT-like protein